MTVTAQQLLTSYHIPSEMAFCEEMYGEHDSEPTLENIGHWGLIKGFGKASQYFAIPDKSHLAID